MSKVALYTAAVVFTFLAIVQTTFYVLDTHILVGTTLFRPFNVLMAAILFTVMAVWMVIAGLDLGSDKKRLP